ncbi:uncharacterized protein LOC113330273 [Papaver somniferum]|uniref:uncharacterized protein LOC113330273 n=1 Tax=Papaver somniferum TaxID=3469 RepID=UPI000E6F8B6D|nr:uncharacterized protein LOC113330273 [Papaver somniferum]
MGGVCSGGGASPQGSPDRFPRSPNFNGVFKRGNCFKDKRFASSDDSDSDGSDFSFGGQNGRKFDCVDLLLCSPQKISARKDKTVNNKKVSKSVSSDGVVVQEQTGEALDTAAGTVPRMRSGSTYVRGTSSRENDVCIHAFEIASTITKGANILKSLSKENMQYLKQRILQSDGVQRLVSTDMEVLLAIAAADKREEFASFLRAIVRFGNLCKAPEWHNLGPYFQKLDLDGITYKKSKEEAESTMEELVSLAQSTSELYHELHTLNKFEQDHRRRLEEVESLQLIGKEDSLRLLNMELNHQKKLVRNLKKKSLWSKDLEEVMEKLVEVVKLIHQEISEAFGNTSSTGISSGPNQNSHRLGQSGLVLHYANIINQIESISCLVSHPNSLPPNTRDTLYQGLPPNVKAGLRSHLQLVDPMKFTELQIRAEMEKTLSWLVPLASNTTKAHQGFGSVGEWANTCNTFNKRPNIQNNSTRLQTLYHADKEKTELCILELVTWLHHLISRIRQRYYGIKPLMPVRSSKPKKNLVLRLRIQQDQPGSNASSIADAPPSTSTNTRIEKIHQLPKQDQSLLQHAGMKTISNPGISKSQDLSTMAKGKMKVEEMRQTRMSQSCDQTPTSSRDELMMMRLTQDLESTIARTNTNGKVHPLNQQDNETP